MAAKKKDFRNFGKIRHPARRVLMKVALFVASVFLFTTIVTSVFLDSVSIGSASMEPTFSIGDRILITPIVFGAQVPFTNMRFGSIREPERGELVVCSAPFFETTPLEALANPFIRFFTLRRVSDPWRQAKDWEDETLIKRVIAVPGDTVYLDNFIAFIKPQESDEFINERVFSNSQYSITLTPLPEGWDASYPFSGTTEPVLLGEGEYFVLGDNRSQSHDSRHFGIIHGEQIRGKVLLRYSPLRKAGGA